MVMEKSNILKACSRRHKYQYDRKELAHTGNRTICTIKE